jgi:hypothetical protein
MVAAHGKVFVVGGEANASSAAGRDDPSLVHILDSCKSFFSILILIKPRLRFDKADV